MGDLVQIATIAIAVATVVFLAAIPFTIRAVMRFLEGVDDD